MTKLSIVIPCFNERNTIETVIDAVSKSPVEEKEIIVVDDFSTDGTREFLNETLKDKIDLLLMQEKNMGKGAAIRRGFQAASGDMVIIQDADLEYDPQEFPKLIAPIVEGKADVVYGSRFANSGYRRVTSFWHYMGNRFLTACSNAFTDLNLTDMETCYKAFRTEVIQSLDLKEDRFGIEPEMTAKLAQIRGLNIYEVGITYHSRSYEEGKKIGWRDGFRALYCIIRYSPFFNGSRQDAAVTSRGQSLKE